MCHEESHICPAASKHSRHAYLLIQQKTQQQPAQGLYSRREGSQQAVHLHLPLSFSSRGYFTLNQPPGNVPEPAYHNPAFSSVNLISCTS